MADIPIINLNIPKPFNINTLDEPALLALRQEIDHKLQLDLKDLDMPTELSLQYRNAKALYSEVASDADTPANQKAQVLNTISSILKEISATSQAVYSVTRLKKIEAATLAAVRDLPLDSKTKFFDMFKEYLDGQ